MNYADIAMVRSIVVYQPIRASKKQCRYRRHHTNCSLIRVKTPNKTLYEHYTVIDLKYCCYNGDPYYEWLLTTNDNRKLLTYKNAYKLICGVRYESDIDEVLQEIEEAGETDIQLVRVVMRYVHNYIENDKQNLNGHAKNDSVNSDSKVYQLFNTMYIQCLYSFKQCVILPQEMYCLYKQGEEPFINSIYYFNTIPETEYSNISQNIYKSFIIYNTVLTMMLRQANPFNDTTKVISKIIESVGTCNGGDNDNKKKYIKICGLNFGGNAPGHIMCPPRDMTKLIYKYAKWKLNPKNYTRYYELLIDDKPKTQERLRDWDIFLKNFKAYFFPS
ncbi:VP1054 [Choristoneura occidentalis granulovirus]|uniref:VP1054 n=1 Tax=Choristoneura occidentalis granulovirus TaxID=364745 RepID=Q1A4I3_9BBAC|nr:VP1054 [Choristoneura fumiferana granulovirus]ABC61247.1 VP1054 [Choristoneura fumiferana granulovirus]